MMTLKNKKISAEKRAKLKQAMIEHIEKNEAFLKEIAEGANFEETAKKYGKKFIAPIPAPQKK